MARLYFYCNGQLKKIKPFLFQALLEERMIEISQENFDEFIKNSNLPLIIEFGAPWCAPCKRLEPELERLASLWTDKVVLGHINVDESPDLTIRFMVMGVPTVILVKEGEVLERFTGFKPLQKMIDLFNQHL
jgi:thioredoxin 1